ncbi:unnamed protein product [Trifolium pratense]|uniref:Uncharacterized protein n=1 Tax=Trifolium pratense TaxID=57577 RepID=A0ACB0JVF8_TRIPR|nr:unnamed protein product [Trifolium pratense]
MHGGVPMDIAFLPSLITRALELYPPISQSCSDFIVTYLYALHRLNKIVQWGALDIVEKARAAGLDLMIGGMVETRLAMGFAGHLAAGLGCFKFIDLDTPLLLSEDPVLDGYEVSGATYKFTNAREHGGFLHLIIPISKNSYKLHREDWLTRGNIGIHKIGVLGRRLSFQLPFL